MSQRSQPGVSPMVHLLPISCHRVENLFLDFSSENPASRVRAVSSVNRATNRWRPSETRHMVGW